MATRTLLDTNVVLRLLSQSDGQHAEALSAVEAEMQDQTALVLAPQVIMECWVVLTRPVDVNGLGWETTLAREALEGLMQRFEVLPETPEVFDRWWELVGTGVRGKRTHDARLVAWMRSHEIERVLTFNVSDFRGFDGLQAVSPAAS